MVESLCFLKFWKRKTTSFLAKSLKLSGARFYHSCNNHSFYKSETIDFNRNTMVNYIASIDQGTTSTRCLIFSDRGDLCASHQITLTQHHPQPGWTEHNPKEIYDAAKSCLLEAVKILKSKKEGANVSAIGITNQRETTIAWDKKTGEHLCNAVVWLDMRTSSLVKELTSKSGKDCFLAKCGLPISTYFSAVKMRWLLDHNTKVQEAASRNDLCFGTVDSWLIYNLTGRKSFKTDVTNASRYMLMNLKTLKWDQDILSFFGLKESYLPEICSSSEIFGVASDIPGLGQTPISGCLGDQQAALVGQQCLQPHSGKNTYGTGCFLLYNIGKDKPLISKNGLLTTVAFKLGANEPAYYALEGSVAIAGAAISWLKSNVGMIASVEEFNQVVKSVNDTEGVYFVPAFTGLFAPYWRTDAKGTIVGMNLKTEKKHIVRAVMEAICFQNERLFRCIQEDLQLDHNPCKSLKVDGGVTNSDVCMQFQADILGMDIKRPAMTECTALGAAIAAGLGAGIWETREQMLQNVNLKSATIFKPQMASGEVSHRLKWWELAVEKALDWDYHAIDGKVTINERIDKKDNNDSSNCKKRKSSSIVANHHEEL